MTRIDDADDALARAAIASAPTALIGLTDSGLVVETHGPVRRLLGLSDEDSRGRSLADLADAQPPWEPDLVAARGGEIISRRRAWIRADGTTARADTVMAPVPDSPRVSVLVHLVALSDGLGGGVNAHAPSVRALATGHLRFRTALQSAPIGMAVTSADGSFIEVNPALMDMLERDEAWLGQHDVASVTHPSDQAELQRMRAELLAPDGPDRLSTEHRLLSARGRPIWVQHSSALMPAGDGPSTFVCQFVDITEMRRARGLLQYLADHDPLTNVMNRRGLLGTMDDGTGSVVRRPALLYCDLDGFKPINDRLGHDAGDRLLVEVAARIEHSLRGDDTVGRIGGDEFVAMLRGIASVDDAVAVADKIRASVAEPFRLGGEPIEITISVGLAVGTEGEHPEATLRRADQALYRAKAAGGDAVAIYEAERDEPRWTSG